MATHRIFSEEPLKPGNLAIAGEEAHHAARVKRLEAGDWLELLDGRGHVGRGQIVDISKERGRGGGGGEWRLEVAVAEVRQVPPVTPRIEVCCPAPKGPRLGDMIDGLSQVGAASWSQLATIRGVTEPRPGKLERLERTALEAAKQCGRAWSLEIGDGLSLKQALVPGPGVRVVVAEAAMEAGGPGGGGGARYRASGAATVRLLVGPEGGWTPEEVELARAAGAELCAFGPHIMRIETAAIAATAVILDAESRPA